MILNDLGYSEDSPTVLYVDNQTTIIIVNKNHPTPDKHSMWMCSTLLYKNGKNVVLLNSGVINPTDAETKAFLVSSITDMFNAP